MTAALSGIRVVDFTHVLAGPACAYFLGLLGAEVIKVESVGKGDAMRHRGGSDAEKSRAGMSTAYLTQAAGKKSIAIDLTSREGAEVMRRLLGWADVLVENHRPETLQSLGLTETQTRAVNPRLIHCALTGYGRGGPQENAPAYDVNIQAASGLMTLTGTAETGPMRTGAPVMDYSVALAAAFAIAAALHHRNQNGEGAFIDVSMLEAALTLMGSTVTDYLATGHRPQPRGNAANSRSPGAGTFPCRSGMLSLGVNEEAQFTALARVVGRAGWLTDARFSNRERRNIHAAALETELLNVLAERDAETWETLMHEAGVPAARLRSLPESLELPQVRARGFIHSDPETGLRLPTLPFRINGAAVHAPAMTPPRHGADSAEVLGFLGYSDKEINSFLSQGVAQQAEPT